MFMHCYFVSGPTEKALPRVRLFSAATSARDVRVTMEITWQFQCFS